MMNELELTGRTRSHVSWVAEHRTALHPAVVGPVGALCAAGRAEGIQLTVASGFRDFDRQLQIWNAKVTGQRPVLDRHGAPVDHARLGEAQVVEAVLAWTALPGTSRHHWGSDIDVYDATVIQPGQHVRLLPEDWTADGPFHLLDGWFEANLRRYGFFRPYDQDRGGVCPEPWHISHVEVSDRALAQLRVEMVAEALAPIDLAAKETVLADLPGLFDRYVRNVTPPTPLERLSHNYD